MGQKGEIEDRPLPISVNHDPTDLIMLHACLELLPNLSPAQNTGIFVFFFFFFFVVEIDQSISSPPVENQLHSGQKEEFCSKFVLKMPVPLAKGSQLFYFITCSLRIIFSTFSYEERSWNAMSHTLCCRLGTS